ncbi:MAG: hypothetical protein ABI725_02545, partial [Chloroflexota bacterium]
MTNRLSLHRFGPLHFGFIAATALLLVALVSTPALAWSPLGVSGSCTDPTHVTWTIEASQTETDLHVDFATDSQFTSFTTYVLDGTTLKASVVTASSVLQAWVRWTADHTAGPWSGTSGACPTATPTNAPTATPTNAPT